MSVVLSIGGLSFAVAGVFTRTATKRLTLYLLSAVLFNAGGVFYIGEQLYLGRKKK